MEFSFIIETHKMKLRMRFRDQVAATTFVNVVLRLTANLSTFRLSAPFQRQLHPEYPQESIEYTCRSFSGAFAATSGIYLLMLLVMTQFT